MSKYRLAPVQSEVLDRQERALKYRRHCIALANQKPSIDTRAEPINHFHLHEQRRKKIRMMRNDFECKVLRDVIEFNNKRLISLGKKFGLPIPKSRTKKIKKANDSYYYTKIDPNRNVTHYIYDNIIIDDEEEELYDYDDDTMSYMELVGSRVDQCTSSYIVFNHDSDAPYISRDLIDQIIIENNMKEIGAPPLSLRKNRPQLVQPNTRHALLGGHKSGRSKSLKKISEPSSRRGEENPRKSARGPNILERKILNEYEVLSKLKRQQKEEEERRRERLEQRKRMQESSVNRGWDLNLEQYRVKGDNSSEESVGSYTEEHKTGASSDSLEEEVNSIANCVSKQPNDPVSDDGYGRDSPGRKIQHSSTQKKINDENEGLCENLKFCDKTNLPIYSNEHVESEDLEKHTNSKTRREISSKQNNFDSNSPSSEKRNEKQNVESSVYENIQGYKKENHLDSSNDKNDSFLDRIEESDKFKEGPSKKALFREEEESTIVQLSRYKEEEEILEKAVSCDTDKSGSPFVSRTQGVNDLDKMDYFDIQSAEENTEISYDTRKSKSDYVPNADVPPTPTIKSLPNNDEENKAELQELSEQEFGVLEEQNRNDLDKDVPKSVLKLGIDADGSPCKKSAASSKGFQELNQEFSCKPEESTFVQQEEDQMDSKQFEELNSDKCSTKSYSSFSSKRVASDESHSSSSSKRTGLIDKSKHSLRSEVLGSPSTKLSCLESEDKHVNNTNEKENESSDKISVNLLGNETLQFNKNDYLSKRDDESKIGGRAVEGLKPSIESTQKETMNQDSNNLTETQLVQEDPNENISINEEQNKNASEVSGSTLNNLNKAVDNKKGEVESKNNEINKQSDELKFDHSNISGYEFNEVLSDQDISNSPYKEGLVRLSAEERISSQIRNQANALLNSDTVSNSSYSTLAVHTTEFDSECTFASASKPIPFNKDIQLSPVPVRIIPKNNNDSLNDDVLREEASQEDQVNDEDPVKPGRYTDSSIKEPTSEHNSSDAPRRRYQEKAKSRYFEDPPSDIGLLESDGSKSSGSRRSTKN